MGTDKLSFELDDGIAAKAAFGLIVLQNDETLEAEFRTLFNVSGIALYHSRIPSALEVNPQTLAQMEIDLPRAAALLPNARALDVIGYGCTSGATMIGSVKIAEIIRKEHPGAKVSNPVIAIIAACHYLNAQNIAMVSPYIPSVSNAMRDLLENSGLNITRFGSFEQTREAVVARISPDSLYKEICRLGSHQDVDIVFASCTNLQSFSIIEKAEMALGKSVISSNLALGWHMHKLADMLGSVEGPGTLFGDK
ncbi:MAG: Asp/Glu racemase [Rhizobiaceae bacterium]|nr:Asp/Glu racemase [Rhizobiaceae bacterium]